MALPPAIIERMRCPACGDAVWVEETTQEGLRCGHGHILPTRDGYVDALPPGAPADGDTARTAASFGYEWTTFDEIQEEDRAYWKMYFRDVPPEAYEGKVVLDAGCGKGRYSAFTAEHAGALAAVDNSDAVEAASRNLGGLANVAVVRADLRSLPFGPATFDFVSCLGVLHHLSDPEDGFRSLVRLLAPGGHVLVYVYSRDTGRTVRGVGLAAAAALRRVTVRLPHGVLRLCSAPLAGVLYVTVVAPGRLGARAGLQPLARLPLASYREAPVRSLWLDTFDRLSAPIEHRYREDEVAAWFHRAGLSVLAVREESGLYVLGAKPAERTGDPVL